MPAITKPKLAPIESKDIDINNVMTVPLTRPANKYDSSMPVDGGGANTPYFDKKIGPR